MTLRIGQGFDVHAFDMAVSNSVDSNKALSDSLRNQNNETAHEIVLGGVRLPYLYPLNAHSDGDVLLHALCDALLGALALGDIGQHFPDSDQQFANVDSRVLLRRCVQLIIDKQYLLSNADLTIVAEKPKMAPYILEMRENIAQDTGVDVGDISVKATTSEHLGFTGRGEGIACFATVLLQK